MSPEMTEFSKLIPGIGQEEFARRIDSASDEFIDEYLRLHGYRREYVVQVQMQRRHQQLLKPHLVVWATFVAGAIAAIASVILLVLDFLHGSGASK